jgi:signal peptidase I
VFRNPENRRQIFVKRVVGLPGDTVEVTQHELLINGKVQHRLSENATPNPPQELSKETIPAGSYYVMGDNRDLSKDSRNFGFLSHGEITGVVTYLFWPSKSWSRFGAVR